MLAILDITAPKEAKEALGRLGYAVLQLPPCPMLPKPVNTHPDMLLFFASDKIYCTKSYWETAREELRTVFAHCARPICTVQEEYGKEYPDDVLLNAVAMGNDLFCHAQATSKMLTSHPAYRVLPVKQGYAKCNTLPLGEHALITSDASIASCAQKQGYDVLRIASGHVQLQGYDYGFIGGCTSFAPYQATREILFCGALEDHPNAEQIIGFCYKHGFTVKSLGAFPLTDVGTILII